MRLTDKKELRQYFKNVRQSISADERKRCDELITRAFLSSDEYKQCKMILCFVSTGIEVSTLDVLDDAFKNKTVLCPKCIGSPKDGIMEFYRVSGMDDLETGTMGIREPKESCERVTEFENALCVLPGLAFGRNGYRLGFGGGYYDRFLVGFNGVKAGLCYESCVCDEMIHDSFDIKADMLFTDKMIYRFSE